MAQMRQVLAFLKQISCMISRALLFGLVFMR
jgi:hypothetical protein